MLYWRQPVRIFFPVMCADQAAERFPATAGVWEWDAVMQSYRELAPDALLQPQKGYWMYVETAVTVTLEAE